MKESSLQSAHFFREMLIPYICQLLLSKLSPVKSQTSCIPSTSRSASSRQQLISAQWTIQYNSWELKKNLIFFCHLNLTISELEVAKYNLCCLRLFTSIKQSIRAAEKIKKEDNCINKILVFKFSLHENTITMLPQKSKFLLSFPQSVHFSF